MKKSFSFTHYYERRNSDISETDALIARPPEEPNYKKYFMHFYDIVLLSFFGLFLFSFFNNMFLTQKYGDIQYSVKSYEKTHILTDINKMTSCLFSIFLLIIFCGLFTPKNPFITIVRKSPPIIGVIISNFFYNIWIVSQLEEISKQ